MVPTDSIGGVGQRAIPLEEGTASPSRLVTEPAGRASIRPAASIDASSPKVPPPAAIDAPSPEELNRQLEDIVSRLNQQLSDSGRALGFRLDSVLNRPVVTVTNQSTGEVVRQIPTEVVVRVAHSIEALKGLIFDKAT